MNFLNMDFMTLKVQEKQKVIYEIKELLNKMTKDYTFEQKILAQALFMERYYHFLQRLLDTISMPVPAVLKDIRNYLWRYLKKECSVEELEEFHRVSDSIYWWMTMTIWIEQHGKSIRKTGTMYCILISVWMKPQVSGVIFWNR